MADKYLKLSADDDATGGASASDPMGGERGWYEAVANLNPGDTLYLMEPDDGGDIIIDYPLDFLGRSGESGSVITIKPYSTNTIKISGGDNQDWPAPSGAYDSPLYQNLMWLEGSYITLEDITIKNSGSNGLRVNPDRNGVYTDVTLKDIVITNCRETGLRVNFIDNLIIDGCIVEYCQCGSNKIWPDLESGGGHSAAVAFHRIHDIEIKNTIVHDNAGEGIIADGTPWGGNYSTLLDIHDNQVYNNAEGNIYIHGLGGTDNKKIYNNIIYSSVDSKYPVLYPDKWDWRSQQINLYTSEDAQGFEDASCQNIDFYNNIIVNGTYGVYMSRGKESTGEHKDIYIENNTFIYNETNIHINKALNNPTSNVLRNNVFIAGDGQKQTAGYIDDFFDTADYNCWHEEGTGTGPATDVQGGNDLNENPDLIDHDATVRSGTLDVANYYPDSAASSPLIDAGVDTSWTTDFAGTTRVSTDFDIGFCEAAGFANDLTPKWTTDKTEAGVWPAQYITENKDTVVTFSDDSTVAGSAVKDDQLWVFEGATTVSNAITAPDGTPTATKDASPTVTWSTAGVWKVTYTVYDATYEHLASGKTFYIDDYARIQLASGGTAGVAYDVVQWDSGDTTINHGLGVIPQAALFVAGSVVTLDTEVDGIDFSVSVCDTSPISCQQSGSVSADGGSAGGFRRSSTSAVKRWTTSDTTYATGTLTAVSSTTLTMSWSGTTTNTEKGYVILIGGASVASATATVLTDLDAVSDTQQVSGSYNLAIALSTLNTGASHVHTNLGFAVKSGNQVCAAMGDDSSAAGEPVAIVRDDAIAAHPASNAYVTASFTDTYVEFTLVGNKLSPSSSADAVHVLLADIGTVGAACGVADSPTAAGDTDYTLSFDPGLLIAGLTNLSATNSKAQDATAGAFGLYANDGTTKFTYGYTIEDAASTNNVATYASAEWRQLDDDQTERSDNDGASTGVTLGTSKFTVNLDPQGGGKFVYLALEDAGTGVGTQADFSYTWPSFTDKPPAGESIQFVDLSSAASGETISAWDWDWGDGTANGTTQNPTHTFTESTYNEVILTVTDSAAGEDSKTYYIETVADTGAWVVAYDPAAATGEAPYSLEVDWSGTSWTGFTIDEDKSYFSVWKQIEGDDSYADGGGSYLIPNVNEYRGYGYSTPATVAIDEPGFYNLGIRAYGVTDQGQEQSYMINIHYDDWTENQYFNDVIKVYSDTEVLVELDTGDDDWRIPHTGAKTITFTVNLYPDVGFTNVAWTFGDGDTVATDATGTQSHEYDAVSSLTKYTAYVDVTLANTKVQRAYTYITIAPTETEPRTEAEILALQSLLTEVSGCIATTDWSATGGTTNTYEATLDRKWAASTARVTEDGTILTARASTALVDANAGSYYVTFSDPDITIYVHPTGSDNPATNGSRYRFIRPA